MPSRAFSPGLVACAALSVLLSVSAVAQPSSPPAGPPQNFLTQLRGQNEVPPVATPAVGLAYFQLKGNQIRFHLIVANIDNVVASHIHIAPAGTNGPVAVNLLGGSLPPGGGPTNGVLAQGTITDADLAGPLAGMTLADLVNEIRAGNAYVNVHTNDGIAPTNTGPGDIASGEIRGQVRALKP